MNVLIWFHFKSNEIFQSVITWVLHHANQASNFDRSVSYRHATQKLYEEIYRFQQCSMTQKIHSKNDLVWTWLLSHRHTPNERETSHNETMQYLNLALKKR